MGLTTVTQPAAGLTSFDMGQAPCWWRHDARASLFLKVATDMFASNLVQDYIRTRLQAGYDPEYLHQLFDFIVYIISSLEAPARSASTKKVRDACLRTLSLSVSRSLFAMLMI